MAFKGGVVLGIVSFNATGSGTTAIGATSNTGTISIGNTSSAAVAIDCGTAGITVGTTGNAHSSTFGSTNSTSSTTVQSGSGALNVTSTNGTMTINSGTGGLNISNDNTATVIAIGTGAGVKNVNIGSPNTTSGTGLTSGTTGISLSATNGPITINSGTGIIAISGDATATTLNIGGGAGVKTVNVGSNNTTSALTLYFSGSAGSALSTYKAWTGFTPTALGSAVAGTTTYTIQQGYYTRIGDIVFIDLYIAYSAATGTGNLTIGALPFTVNNAANSAFLGTLRLDGVTWPIGTTSLSISATVNSTNALLLGSGSTIASAVVQIANTSTLIQASFWYRV